MKFQRIKKDLLEAMSSSKPKTSAYDTEATVTRIEGGTAWVHIPGGVDETPVAMSVDAHPGDKVRVRVGGGTAWLVGNDTAPPTKTGQEEIIEALKAHGISADWIDTGAFTVTQDGRIMFRVDAVKKLFQWAAANSELDADGNLTLSDNGESYGSTTFKIQRKANGENRYAELFSDALYLHDGYFALGPLDTKVYPGGFIFTFSDSGAYHPGTYEYTTYTAEFYHDTFRLVRAYESIQGLEPIQTTVFEVDIDAGTVKINGQTVPLPTTPTFTEGTGTTVTSQSWSKVGNIVTGDMTFTLAAALTSSVSLGTLSVKPDHAVIGMARTTSAFLRCSISNTGAINLAPLGSTAIPAGTSIQLTLTFVAS